jgi:hypothetical protein
MIKEKINTPKINSAEPITPQTTKFPGPSEDVGISSVEATRGVISGVVVVVCKVPSSAEEIPEIPVVLAS